MCNIMHMLHPILLRRAFDSLRICPTPCCPSGVDVLAIDLKPIPADGRNGRRGVLPVGRQGQVRNSQSVTALKKEVREEERGETSGQAQTKESGSPPRPISSRFYVYSSSAKADCSLEEEGTSHPLTPKTNPSSPLVTKLHLGANRLTSSNPGIVPG